MYICLTLSLKTSTKFLGLFSEASVEIVSDVSRVAALVRCCFGPPSLASQIISQPQNSASITCITNGP
jgi:hypothetical protein